MSHEERISTIRKLLDQKRAAAEHAPADVKKRVALALLAATGMYTETGQIKEEYDQSRKAG